MRIIRIWNPISCIPYHLKVTLFMNRPILVQLVCKIMKFSNTFVPLVYICPPAEIVAVTETRFTSRDAAVIVEGTPSGY